MAKLAVHFIPTESVMLFYKQHISDNSVGDTPLKQMSTIVWTRMDRSGLKHVNNISRKLGICLGQTFSGLCP